MNTWFVYIIRCTDGSLYTGSTNHVVQRWYKHKKRNGAKYLKAHEPKAVVFIEEHPQETVDYFTLNTLKAFLEQPKLLEAFKKRVEFNSKDRIEDLESELQGIYNNKKRIVSKINEIQETIINNTSNRDLWEEKLSDLKSDRDVLDSEIDRINKELSQLKDSRIIDTSTHIKIIKEFNQEFEKRSLDEQKELVQTLIREVESTVQNKDGSYKGEGEIIISYVCDEYLEAEWPEIKKD